MTRFAQPAASRGSQKWLQLSVNRRPEVLDGRILPYLDGAKAIEWLSPIEADGFAEYRDAGFLRRLGVEHHAAALASFWPAGGPQWDGLARSNRGDLILVEAKSHIRELISSCKAGTKSAARISAAFDRIAAGLGARPNIDWKTGYYQFANRIAHLGFLLERGEAAWLVCIHFVGDRDMNGPETDAEWRGAIAAVTAALGLPRAHPLAHRMVEIFVDVAELAGDSAASVG